MTPTITVAIFGPLPSLVPLAEFAIGPSVTSATVSEQLPGGLDRLQLSYDATSSGVRAVVPTPPVLIDGSHIVVYADSAVMFEGTVTSWQPGQLEAQGYGTWALGWGSVGQGGEEQVTSGVMAAMILHSNPWLVPTQLIDPVVMHAWSEVQDSAPIDVIRRFCTEGGEYNGVQYPWMLVTGVDRLTRFVPMAPPAITDHVLSYDPDVLTVQWDTATWDGVTAAYTIGSTRYVIGPYYRGGFSPSSSYARIMHLTASGQDASGAISFAQTELAKHAAPRANGAMRVTDFAGLRYHAGDTARLQGYIEGDDTTVAYLTSVSHDLISGETSVTLGDGLKGTPLALLRDMVATSAAARRGISPLTWS
jgi:hypothetical protein